MALYKEIPGYTWPELLRRWRSHEPDEPGTDDGYLDEVALELRERGPEGIAFLKAQLDQSDGVRLTAAVLGLTAPPIYDADVPRVLLGLLADGRPLVVAAAIRGLMAYERADALSRILPLIRHPSPYVRCAALEFVRRQDPDNAMNVLLASLSDGDYLVRMCAVDELDALGDPSSLAQIRPLLADAHPHVRQAAETAVVNLAAELVGARS